MSKQFYFKCDKCPKRARAKWNGETFLNPVGWTQLYDDVSAMTLDLHLCEKCSPKRRAEEVEDDDD